VANAQILNATGTKVFQLVANALLSTEGFFSWDGRTDNGKIANAGIYVLFFEMIQPETGEKKQLKIPIVVSAR
jgi:flagellar hook assembly protein FlgD